MQGYSLDDAVVFHDQLNPAIWDQDGGMRPEVREHLLEIAQNFQDFLGIEDLNLVDITVSGSNAAYSYTPHSDIDLHLVARIPDDMSPLYREFFDAKKNLYNLTHNLKIRGFDVELYVQDELNPVQSLGIYSVLHERWLSVPKKIAATVDDLSVKSKVDAMSALIHEALKTGKVETMKQAWESLKKMRKAGLDAGGEFSPENLAFKILRTQGLNKQLYDKIIDMNDQELSLEHIEEDLEDMIG